MSLVEEDLGAYYLDVIDSPLPNDDHNSNYPSISQKKKSKKDCWTLRFDGSKSKMGGRAVSELQNPKKQKVPNLF